MDEINKPSKGTELLQSLQNEPKIEDVSTIIQPPEVEQSVLDEPQDTSKADAYTSFIKNGVEVVDVKAIEKKKLKPIVDRHGIPRHPDEYNNFDHY